MVWLYLPESEGLISESTSLFPHLEPCVSLRGTPMLPQSLERKWKKGGFIRLLSGLMLPPSTGDLLLKQWITSAQDFHASPGVSQDIKTEQMMKDGFGTTLKESFARLDPASSSWKTSQVSLWGDLTPFLGTWPKSGSMLNGVCSKRLPLVQDIPASVSFSLDMFNTPVVSDGHNSSFPKSQANWDSLVGDLIRNGDARNGGYLNPQWVEWLMGWPIGWTESEHVEMESSHYKQESHIQSSSIEQLKEVV